MKKEVSRTNKRGQDLSIGTLILIVLGIVVLVLLILGFSIGWDTLWEKINIFGGTTSVGDVVTACKLATTSQDTYTYCQKTWKIKIDTDNDGKKEPVDLSCRHNLVQPNVGDGLNCPPPTKSCKGGTTCTATTEAACKAITGCTWE